MSNYVEYEYYIPSAILGIFAAIAFIAAIAVIMWTVFLTLKKPSKSSGIHFVKLMKGMLITAISVKLLQLVILIVCTLDLSVYINFTYFIASDFLMLTASIISLIYICGAYKKTSSKLYIPLIMGTTALHIVLNMIPNFTQYTNSHDYISYFNYYVINLAENEPIAVIATVLSIIVLIGGIAALIAAAVFAAKGLIKTNYIIIGAGITAAVLLVFFMFDNLYEIESYYRYDNIYAIALSILNSINTYVSPAFLCVTLGIIGINAPEYVNAAKKEASKQNISRQTINVSPELALRNLATLRAQGLISEEEFKTRRAEILDNI